MLDAIVYFWLGLNKSEVRDYSLTFDKTIERKIQWYNAGGKALCPEDLTENILAVMDRLSFVPTDENIAKLVLETIAIESSLGKHTKQIKGPALGASQIEPATWKDLKNWMKTKPVVYKEVMALMDKNQSEEYNLKHSLATNIAATIAIYYRYNGSNLALRCRNKYMRYLLYKSRFNTVHGASTSSKYFTATKGVTE